jgi:hypothetical protein
LIAIGTFGNQPIAVKFGASPSWPALPGADELAVLRWQSA